MYESNYQSNPTITLNPFTDSLESVVVFRSQKEFLDSLRKAVVDAGGNPEMFVTPDITLTQLMNTLAINGVRFTFDVNAKKGSSLDVPTVLPVTEDVVVAYPEPEVVADYTVE
jgi:hypothetical protein